MGFHFLLLTTIFVITLSQTPYPEKHLAGPSSEFLTHRVPVPTDTISVETSSSQYIWFEPGLSNGAVYSMDIPVDGSEKFVFSFSSPHQSTIGLELHDPNGKVIDLEPLKNEGSIPIGESFSVPATTYIISNAINGHYTLNFFSSLPQHQVAQLAQSAYPNAVLTVINNDNLVIESHMTSYLIKVGKEIGIVSNVVNLTPQFDPNDIHVSSAEMEIITPDGKDVEIPMKNTNLEDDEQTSYTAHFTPTVPGEYIIQAKLGGYFSDMTEVGGNIPFVRSTQQVIHVSDATVELTGKARARPLDPSHILVDIETTGNAKRLRAYAEVLGVDSKTKEKKEVCWIGGVVQINNNVVTLELDTNWLLLAGASGPLTLQNVYLSDLDTSYPVSIYSADIPVDQSEIFQYVKPLHPISITKEMRNGRNPLKDTSNVTATAAPSLLLLPGYCSTGNPFEGNTFTNGAFFKTGGGNLSNDKFSLQVLDYIKSQSMNSFSIIGHSQGGMVALHLHNYYFTGMDMATNGRLIQTVGTPFSGCTAAGALANLGDLFGIGCGSNNDLSLDGAVNWLSGITTESRSKVYFYTTTYQQGNFFGDYCNLPINLILQWPNDGTTEFKYATLAGGNNLGNKQKWCHITGMKYPAQYNDATRNAEMDKAAAR